MGKEDISMNSCTVEDIRLIVPADVAFTVDDDGERSEQMNVLDRGEDFYICENHAHYERLRDWADVQQHLKEESEEE